MGRPAAHNDLRLESPDQPPCAERRAEDPSPALVRTAATSVRRRRSRPGCSDGRAALDVLGGDTRDRWPRRGSNR